MNKAPLTDILLLITMCSWQGLIGLSGIRASAFCEQDNEGPKVSILAPGKNGNYRLNSRVPYKISVSDREDGESKYDEINSGEVLLEIRYIPGAENKDTPGVESPVTENGLLGIASSNCLYCHAFRGTLIGPSFEEIGLKYKQTRQDMEEIAQRILNGSTGVWGEKVMPSHPELTRDEIMDMLAWISTYATHPGLQYQNGLEGTIELQPDQLPGTGEGTIVLTAAYRDHGTGGTSKKTGTDRVVLHVNQ